MESDENLICHLGKHDSYNIVLWKVEYFLSLYSFEINFKILLSSCSYQISTLNIEFVQKYIIIILNDMILIIIIVILQISTKKTGLSHYN